MLALFASALRGFLIKLAMKYRLHADVSLFAYALSVSDPIWLGGDASASHTEPVYGCGPVSILTLGTRLFIRYQLRQKYIYCSGEE